MQTREALAAAAVFFLVTLSGCTSLKEAAADGERLDNGLHAKMIQGDWAGIYAGADPGFREGATTEKSQAYFSAVIQKLGTPGPCKLSGWRLNATTSGTFLSTQCATVFSNNASGTEEIVWKQSDGQYRLYKYRVSSDDLVTR